MSIYCCVMPSIGFDKCMILHFITNILVYFIAGGNMKRKRSEISEYSLGWIFFELLEKYLCTLCAEKPKYPSCCSNSYRMIFKISRCHFFLISHDVLLKPLSWGLYFIDQLNKVREENYFLKIKVHCLKKSCGRKKINVHVIIEITVKLILISSNDQ